MRQLAMLWKLKSKENFKLNWPLFPYSARSESYLLIVCHCVLCCCLQAFWKAVCV